MTDYIDRQGAIDAILDCCPSDFNNEYECGYDDGLRQGVHRLKHLPSVEVEPVKRGYWKTTNPGDPMLGAFICSECGALCRNVHWNYCPCCGAKMLR